MLKSIREHPALSISELGLLIVGLVLTALGFINFFGAFTADNLAFVGALIFLVTGGGCLFLSLCALLGYPRSIVWRSSLMAAGWVGAAYPLGLALTYLPNGWHIAALPVAAVGVFLALISIRKKQTASALMS